MKRDTGGEFNSAEHVSVAIEQVLMGIDPGEKRVGIALKPAGTITAEPLMILANDQKLWQKIIELAQEHQCETVIVGLPRNVDGNDTAQTGLAREFAGELADRSDLHVLMNDEFSTSSRARERMAAKYRRPTRDQEKKELDAIAAAILLEDYLESLV